jgi:hypothetical protein
VARGPSLGRDSYGDPTVLRALRDVHSGKRRRSRVREALRAVADLILLGGSVRH